MVIGEFFGLIGFNIVLIAVFVGCALGPAWGISKLGKRYPIARNNFIVKYVDGSLWGMLTYLVSMAFLSFAALREALVFFGIRITIG